MDNINTSDYNDDRCIDLLEIINMEDYSSPLSINSKDSKGDDCFYRDIMLALDKKDFQKIVSLALSKSQGGHRMGAVLKETMLAIERSSKETMDCNFIEKLTSFMGAQSRENAAVQRATVAPIRNESIVCSSISNIPYFSVVQSNVGSHVSTLSGFTEGDLESMLSRDVTDNTRSYVVTDSRTPLYLSDKTDDSHKLESDKEYPCQATNVGSTSAMQTMKLSESRKLPYDTQYPSSFLNKNGIVCIVTPSLSDKSLQTMYLNNAPHNRLDRPHNMLMSPSCNGSGQCQSFPSTCSTPSVNVSDVLRTSIPSSIIYSNNLPSILLKPNNRIIAPRTHYLSQPFITKEPVVSKRSNVPLKVTETKNTCVNASKDNIFMAWKIADQLREIPRDQLFLSQLESPIQDFSVIKGLSAEDNYENHLDQLNIFAKLDILEGFTPIQYCTTIVLNTLMSEACSEEVIQYSHSCTFVASSLVHATVSFTPSNMQHVRVITESHIVDECWSQSFNNSRMLQLLCSHLGRHSDILSPLLRSLLPQTFEHHRNLLNKPISVSTEEENQILEDELLLINRSSTSEALRTRLPYQSTEDLLTLHNVIKTNFMSWLKKGKRRNKWKLDASFIRSSQFIVISHIKKKRRMRYLRKKTNYRICNSLGRSIRVNVKYSSKINKILYNKIKASKEYPSIIGNYTKQSTNGLLKIRIHLPKNNIKDPSIKSFATKMEDDIVDKDKTDNNQCCEVTSSLSFPEIRDSDNKDTKYTMLGPSIVEGSSNIHCINTPSRTMDSTVTKQSKHLKRLLIKKSQKKRSRGGLKLLPCVSKQFMKSSVTTKRIFCTRKEDRRSSALHTQVIVNRKTKMRKKCNTSAIDDDASLMMKVSSNKSVSAISLEDLKKEDVIQTTDSIKLLIKRSGHCTYRSQISSVLTTTMSDNLTEHEAYKYNSTVNLVPPNQLQLRPLQAVLQFSPTHSSNDSDDVGATHNDIISLLQRQERSEPVPVSNNEHNINQITFPSLSVSYLVGSDPTVFMDPHEVELIIVKNSRYKKSFQIDKTDFQAPTITPANIIFSTDNISEIFVPGCFIDDDKTETSWDRSSPSMPILAPQEPFTTIMDLPKGSSSQSAEYSQSTQTRQKYSGSNDNTQRSPLCMATTNTRYSSSQKGRMVKESIKSPYQKPDYQYQSTHDIIHLEHSLIPAPATDSSKSPLQLSSVLPQISVNNSCSSQLPNYSYFNNSVEKSLMSLVSSEASIFSTPSSSYQSIQESHLSKASLKRSSSSRTNVSADQYSLSSKKRREPSSLSTPSMNPNNSDLYNASLDYYDSGFSNIFNSMDQMKLYEQYASLQLGSFYNPNIPWSNAMVEYCKQTQMLNAPSFSNPLSHIQDSEYSNPYSAYAMSQPYSSMYNSFGVPK